MPELASVGVNKEYVELLKKHGIGVPADHKLLLQLCNVLTKSASACVTVDTDESVIAPEDRANMIAATDPVVADVLAAGIMQTREGAGLLVLPPDWLTVTRLRDAIWVEGDTVSVKRGERKERSRRETLAGFARELCVSIQRTFAEGGLPLGPRSFRCHQDHAIASTRPGELFDPGAHETRENAERHPHGHDAWERLVIALPSPWHQDVTLNLDVCMKCMSTTRVTTRLGLAIIHSAPKHEHKWTAFSAPAPDARGRAGTVRGEVCLVPVPPSFAGARPGRCMATRKVRYIGRAPVLSVAPPWVRHDKPVLRMPVWSRRDRPSIKSAVRLSSSHVHVWDQGRYTFGTGAALPFLRCVTCECELWSNQVHGVSVPPLLEELRRRVGKVGGFACGPIDAIDQIYRELAVQYPSEKLARFADQLALDSCKEGLRAASPAKRTAIWRAVSKFKDEGELWRPVRIRLLRNGREVVVRGHEIARGKAAGYLVYEIDGEWEITHTTTHRSFTARGAASEDDAMVIARDLYERGIVPERGARDAGIVEVEDAA